MVGANNSIVANLSRVTVKCLIICKLNGYILTYVKLAGNQPRGVKIGELPENIGLKRG